MTDHNAFDREAFSGTPFYMRQALDAHPDVSLRVTGGHRPPSPGALSKVIARVRRGSSFRFDPAEYASLDAVVAPVASGLVAHHAQYIPAPVVLVTDATPQFLRDFYDMNVPDEDVTAEGTALRQAARVVYSSDYMAARAVAEFPGLNADTVTALPFGINLDALPDRAPPKPPLSTLNLLFIGLDWSRKGGDRALALLDVLLARGVSARLTMIGGSPPGAEQHPQVTALGYLDKTKPEDARRLADALAAAHVFVLPTRADCTPMVVAEANANGAPVLITQTGGIPSLMAPGQNGQMLPPDADADVWADAVQALTADAAAYAALSARSFDHAHARLTWAAWADGIVQQIREVARA